MTDFDAIVIGSGFGGAVAACRLVQGGKRICLLERGRRYESGPSVEAGSDGSWSDFPSLPSDDRALPDPECWGWGDDQGLWDVRNLRGIVAVQAAGYGGGSLIYANVHLRAPKEVFAGWPFSREEIDPYYDLVAYMLNVKPITEAPFAMPEKTLQFERAAEGLGRAPGFFYPPLTINFTDGCNAFGRSQRACNACGECLTGCRNRAKNSLDLNYLAIVEDSGLADVRTQAEAVSIAAKDGGYDVTYLDHLRGGTSSVVSARWVFVCAGAIHSTELLLKSKASHGLPNLNGDALGSRFFPNADFPAVVYDARTPKGEPRLLRPTNGPTITASLYHEDRSNGNAPGQKAWFLLQEGGFPIAAAQHMGVFRAPVLLRRNRHDDRKLRAHDIGPVPGLASSPANVEIRHESTPVLLRSLADGFYAILKNESEILEKVAPDQLEAALHELEAQFDDFEKRHLLTILRAVRRKTRNRSWWMKIVPDCLIPTAERLWEDTKEVLREEYGLGGTARERVELATRLAKWSLKFDDTRGAHSQNSMVLLAMGHDTGGGTIELENDTLSVELAPRSDASYTRAECLMRDVACALGGKLRVNPLWSFARTPVTVHNQGGCPMSNDPRHGVTDHAGQVHGHPGLFVMDAAAFPGSVGVNPSATIAAVAERNMAQLLGQPKQMEDAREWWARQAWKNDEKVALEPRYAGRWVSTKNRPVGLEFSEEMSGFHYADPVPGKNDDAAYRAAEVQGRRHESPLSLRLKATIEDVAAFIHSPDHAIQIEGTAHLIWREAGITSNTASGISGTLSLFGSPQEAGQRLMRYQLSFDELPFVLAGYKRIRNDPGPDAWRDTSALFMTLGNPKSGARSYGVIHVALDGFLFDQLPSFRVTNTDDPARIAWTLASFGAYFFGQVQRIYVPQLEKVVEAFAGLEIR